MSWSYIPISDPLHETAFRNDKGSQGGARYQADKIKTLEVMIIHDTYSESSYLLLLDGGCLIKINQLLWEILIYYRFIHLSTHRDPLSILKAIQIDSICSIAAV